MVPLPAVSVEASASGSVVTVDGRPVPSLEAWRIEQVPGDVPRLTLSLPAEGTIDAEAVVQVTSGEARDLLARLDPKQLEQDALNRSVTQGCSFVEALLSIVGEAL